MGQERLHCLSQADASAEPAPESGIPALFATARMYRDPVQPDEAHLHESGREAPGKAPHDAGGRRAGPRPAAALWTLETVVEVQAMVRLKTGIASGARGLRRRDVSLAALLVASAILAAPGAGCMSSSPATGTVVSNSRPPELLTDAPVAHVDPVGEGGESHDRGDAGSAAVLLAEASSGLASSTDSSSPLASRTTKRRCPPSGVIHVWPPSGPPRRAPAAASFDPALLRANVAPIKLGTCDAIAIQRNPELAGRLLRFVYQPNAWIREVCSPGDPHPDEELSTCLVEAIRKSSAAPPGTQIENSPISIAYRLPQRP